MEKTKGTWKKKEGIPTYESQHFGGKIVFDPDLNKNRMMFNAQALWQNFLDKTCKVGDEVSFYITNKRPKRSDQQNRYYHLYLSLISLSSGYTIEELKIWAKGKFLSKGITTVFGERVRIVKSSADLRIGEFVILLDSIEQETGIPLPITEPFLNPLSHKEYENLKESQRQVYSRLKAKIQ